MRAMWSTVKYRMQCYFKGNAFVMPFIVICVFMRFMYSIRPMDVVSGCFVTVNFLFLFMACIGMSEINRENRVMEQILELRVHQAWAYFAGKILFLFLLSLIVSAICTIWPFLQNMIDRGTFFEREYLMADFVNSFLLNLGSAYTGVMLGSFLHPDVCRNRKMAIALTALFVVLADIQEMIVLARPILRYVLWFLPNVALAGMQYENAEYFSLNVSLCCFLVFMMYAGVYGIVGSLWQYKKRA